MNTPLTRRTFLSTAAAATGLSALTPGQAAGQSPETCAMPLRPLGKTGRMISIVGFGGGSRYLLQEDMAVAEQMIHRAIELGIKKVQLFKPYFNQEMIDKAHAHGIRCNVCWSNDPEETERFLTMGIDTILTDDYHRIAQVVKAFGKK